jgi:tol-pal system protein YbgF
MMMRESGVSISLMASLVLAIFVSSPVAAQIDDKQVMFDLVIQIQQLQAEVRMLRGMLEDQTIELENLGNRQKDQYLDLDQRITELRSVSPGPMVSTGAVTTAGTYNPSVEPGPEVREDVPELRPALTTSSSVTGIALPDTRARAVTASPEVEKVVYDRAFQSLKDLKYADASEQFLTFLTQYPGSEYADNAQNWLGESYWNTGNYELALEAFQRLIANYPDSPKIIGGLWKIGLCHYKLQQWDQARAALVQLQEQYPDTTHARLARSQLSTMKREGHF